MLLALVGEVLSKGAVAVCVCLVAFFETFRHGITFLIGAATEGDIVRVLLVNEILIL